MSEAVVHVVDDDESARESLAFLLEAADFEVVSHPRPWPCWTPCLWTAPAA